MTRELLFSMRKVILDGMRKVILDVDTYPRKWLNMSFSPLNSRHLLTALGVGGRGGVWTLPLLFQSIYTRMVHLSISGTETMLRYILWRQSTLLLTKKVTRNGNLRCFVAKSVVTNIRYARFFVFFGTPQVGPFVKFECIFYALVRPNLQR